MEEKRQSVLLALLHVQKETPKQILSNSSVVSSLSRYTSRHNAILEILASWFLSVLSGEHTLFVDLKSTTCRQVVKIFQTTVRPDLTIIYDKSIFVLELTICHESNFSKLKDYERNNYENIDSFRLPMYSNYAVNLFTLEISVSGFLSLFSQFLSEMDLTALPKQIRQPII